KTYRRFAKGAARKIARRLMLDSAWPGHEGLNHSSWRARPQLYGRHGLRLLTSAPRKFHLGSRPAWRSKTTTARKAKRAAAGRPVPRLEGEGGTIERGR